MAYCQVVILDIVSQDLDKAFTYYIPNHYNSKIQSGSLVRVPFGKRSTLGLVLNVIEQPDIDADLIKSVSKLNWEIPVITSDLMKLAAWMRDYYICPISKVFNTMLPKGLKLGAEPLKEEKVTLVSSLEEALEVIPKNAIKQQKMVELLEDRGTMMLPNLLRESASYRQSINSLQKKGLVEIHSKWMYRDPIQYEKYAEANPPEPTHEQQKVLDLIEGQTKSERKKPVVVYGVTGSGKTEIYLRVIERYLKLGQDAIVLIPEISLTPQTIARFVSRFGELVAVLHSRLSVGERFDQWRKIINGDAKIVIGARSAVFAPFKNLGLIIIDEEHEYSYKQEVSPRYHTREVAIKRGELVGGQVILGSATPSLESIYAVKGNHYLLGSLPERVTTQQLPGIHVVDMREELKRGNRSIFSRALVNEIKRTTDGHHQAILFLNRRGYATFLLCRECGHSISCPRCEVTLTYHKSLGRLLCHYCDYTEPYTKHCPHCESGKIREFGVGTERIETELKKIFPYLNTIRMDVDTTRRKGAHEKLLEQFMNGEADVLIGTQMIAKGLHLPQVALVGVITADTALNLPDFRAGEKTFQLLTQVSGRAGRGEAPGKVVIQTYNPEHYSIKAVKSAETRGFYRQELTTRKELGYPPYTQLVRILLRSKKFDMIKNMAENMAQELMGLDLEILGPTPCPIPKIKDEHRWHLMIRLSPEKAYQDWRSYLLSKLNKLVDDDEVRMAIDVDPVNVL